MTVTLAIIGSFFVVHGILAIVDAFRPKPSTGWARMYWPLPLIGIIAAMVWNIIAAAWESAP